MRWFHRLMCWTGHHDWHVWDDPYAAATGWYASCKWCQAHG